MNDFYFYVRQIHWLAATRPIFTGTYGLRDFWADDMGYCLDSDVDYCYIYWR